MPTRLRCQGGLLHWGTLIHTQLWLTWTPVTGRQVLTSSPFPMVPPGTQGPQLLLGLVPVLGGPSGHGGRSASGVGTVKAGGEKQRMKAGGEEREVGQLGCWPPIPSQGRENQPLILWLPRWHHAAWGTA